MKAKSKKKYIQKALMLFSILLSGQNTLIFLFVLIFQGFVFADSRTDYPIQLHAHFPFGIVAHRLHIGYHFNEAFYLGISKGIYESSLDIDRENRTDCEASDNRSALGQDGVCDFLDAWVTKDDILELRYSPTRYGFFLSLAYIDKGRQRSFHWYDRRARRIGDNSYDADLQIKIERKRWRGPGYGIGYNHVFDKHVSVCAALIGNFSTPIDTDIEISSSNNSITYEDYEKEKEIIRDSSLYKAWYADEIAVVILAVGYNF
ncbi:MAG: hypothetical protein GY866_08160 [Proteobacteria bacterium]|nr:hypothetical protein [Pseudomonadota bacterium]